MTPKIELAVETYTVYIDGIASGEVTKETQAGEYIFILPDSFSITPLQAQDLRQIADLMDNLPK